MLILSAFNISIATESEGICYKSIDSNSDGKITLEEFKKKFGDNEKRFKAIDKDKNGMLSHEEYDIALGKKADKLHSLEHKD